MAAPLSSFPGWSPYKDPDPPKTTLVNSFRELLASGKGSDLTITCGWQTFNVHKVIVCSRSDFFAAACWGDFKEAESNRIDLPEDHPAVITKMLDYLYTLEYTDDRVTTSPFMNLAVHVLVYGIADKYSIAGLKDLAMEKMEDSLGFPGHLATADGTRELLVTIELAWTSTPASDKGMREPILKYCKKYLDLLLEMEAFKAAMVEIPDMAYDFLAQEVKDRFRR